ncbi:RusA family crossover junction endodeoxyribonuclease [Lactobacillus taiwanensis]|uniref:RusA family crossover junction endodeoxyribonuclease n=1 Tax=Lactobacillus taiwanensis TaxID=508451 RepID=UPI000B993F63|nr:RusA family crossover junction endodeoxyribonuclease [Lactobacillus taiwanensis]OYR95100.1 Holliday junction resolvase [Lactobacillus taiwanensis]OYS02505.1 Holliday junction resolvase [Lactobacillus taiwanensis]OYS16224.1 Holliday junction resolvase [Lactobacillus taiwanensis]OYS16287.1 Holliday junction resolvase [Lactobacillus taiwanensis]OYS32357.1 Holliday junction resolvase [Lactobacillus taiwanensis]
MRVEFTIEGPPVGKARPRVTRTVTYTPAKTARYEDLVRYTAINSFKGVFDKDEPLDVKIIAYFEIPKSWSKKRKALCLSGIELPTKKPDIDNISKIIMDGMNPKTKRNKQLHKMVEVMRGIYHDDKQVTTLLVKKRYSERPRVEVKVMKDLGDWSE